MTAESQTLIRRVINNPAAALGYSLLAGVAAILGVFVAELPGWVGILVVVTAVVWLEWVQTTRRRYNAG